MKTPGDYALLHANGMPWKDVIAAIRAETVADYRQVPFAADESESASPYVSEEGDYEGPLHVLTTHANDVEFYDTSGVE